MSNVLSKSVLTSLLTYFITCLLLTYSGSLVQAYLTALNSGDTDAVAEKSKQIVFSPTFKPTFGTLKVKKITGSGPELEILPPSDAAPIIAAAYASYLTVYLPETFFVGCTLVGGQPLRSDGALYVESTCP